MFKIIDKRYLMKKDCLNSAILITWLLFGMAEMTMAQTNSSNLITLDLQNVRIEEALKRVADYYSLSLWYSESRESVPKKISIQLRQASFQQAMKSILEDTDLQYTFPEQGKLLVTNKADREIENGSIAGKIVDKKTKQPIPSVNVVVLGTPIGITTDIEGEYFLKDVPENIYKLKFSSLGYAGHIETDIRVVRGKTTTVKEIELNEMMLTADSILVTAGYFSNDNVSPVTNFTYNREEIRRNPGSQGDIFRAIETLPGVGGSGGEFSAFAVRGSSPRDNIILIDNIPFDKVAHLVAGSEEDEAQGGRYSILTPGLIDEALFQAGGFGAQYGGKNSSFLDLKIKEGNKESFIANGTYDLFGWEVNYDGPTYMLGNTSLLLSARHHDFDRMLEMIDLKDLGQIRFSDVIAKTTTEISPEHKLSIIAIYSPEHFGRTIDNVFDAKNNDFETFVGSLDETKYLLGANWRYLVNTESFLENTVYLKRTDTEYHYGRVYINVINGVVPAKETVPIRQDYINSNSNQDQYGLKSLYTVALTSYIAVQTGGEIFMDDFRYRYEQQGVDTSYIFDGDDYRPDPLKYFTIIDPHYINTSQSGKKLNAALFVDYRHTFWDRLMVMSGLRYEYGELYNQQTISPRFSASYQLSEQMKIHLATGIYYQMPQYSLLMFDKSNTSLHNERAVHYIVGWTYYLNEEMKMTVEAYRKDLRELLVHTDRTRRFRTNGGTGYAQGIDIGLIKRFSDQWYGQMNFSYAQSRRNDNYGSGEYNADFSQPYIANILLGYELNKEWSFSMKWKFASGRPKDSYVVHSNIFQDSIYFRYSKEITGNNNLRYSDFHTLNIRIDYRKQFGSVPVVGGLAIVAFLDILNLYNQQNPNSEEFRETSGKVLTNGLGMLPTIGVKLEF